MLPGGVLPEDVKPPCGETGGFAGGAARVPGFCPGGRVETVYNAGGLW